TVFIADERDEGRAIRIVFEALNSCAHIQLVALEVNKAIAALVSATLKTGSDATIVVAAALVAQTNCQALDGLALIKAGSINDHQLALSGGNRLVMLKCHIPFLAP